MHHYHEAISVHREWATHFERVIHEGGKDLNPEIVGRDDACALGMWIHLAGGEDLAQLHEFRHLELAHLRFHECSKKVLLSINEGNTETAKRILDGAWNLASVEVINAANALRREVEKTLATMPKPLDG